MQGSGITAIFSIFAILWVRAEPVITVDRTNCSSSAGHTGLNFRPVFLLGFIEESKECDGIL